MQNLSFYINNFESIALKDMDSVQLMNRTDTKFIFHTVRLPELLEKVCNYYKILQIEEERDFPYHTVYMDTKDFHFLNSTCAADLIAIKFATEHTNRPDRLILKLNVKQIKSEL